MNAEERKKYDAERYRKNRDVQIKRAIEWRNKNKERFLENVRNSYHRRMETNPDFRKYRKEINKTYYRKHKAKILMKYAIKEKGIAQKARHELRYAVRDGRIKKPSICDACGCSEKIQGHHEDYSKPLSVIWLCKICHEKLHHLK